MLAAWFVLYTFAFDAYRVFMHLGRQAFALRVPRLVCRRAGNDADERKTARPARLHRGVGRRSGQPPGHRKSQ